MQTILERLIFLRKFLHSPRSIGSITPSSRFLVRAIVKSIPWNHTQTIVELGSGTGVVTRAINSRKQDKCQLILFEQEAHLQNHISKLFPHARIGTNAMNLLDELQGFKVDQVDCIVSCLPFANISKIEQQQILNQVEECLSPNGTFIAYQYSLQLLPELQNRFSQVKIKFIPINLPPSFLYVCKKGC